MEKSNIIKDYIKELEHKNEVLQRAFALACRCLREHPPADTCDHIELAKCVIGGKNDPEGKRWMTKFLLEAEAEMKGDNYASESCN